MFITRIRLENWRNFREVDVPLQQRTFIVGPNASGKSNLLDAVRFLRDVANVGLQQALELRGGISKVRALAGRQEPGLTLDVSIGEASNTSPTWRYRLAIRREPAGRHRTLITDERVWDSDGSLILRRPSTSDRDDDELLTQTALEQVGANRAFRDAAAFLKSVEYLHLVPQMIRHGEESRASGPNGDPFGRGFLELIADTPKKTQQSRLKKIGKQLHSVLPQFDETLTIERDNRGQPHLEARFQHWRPSAARQREDQFSDGTLRLIGLLWALMDAKGPLLLEEPELSLQADVVGRLAGMFARVTTARTRQVLITTHSYDLLQDEGIAPEEVITVEPSPEGSTLRTGADDPSAVAIAEAGGSAGEMLLASAISRGGAQLPLNV